MATAQNHDKIDGRDQAPPRMNETTAAASNEDNEELPKYCDIEPPPPQLPSRRRASRTDDHPRASRLERQLQDSRVYRRASATERDGNEVPPQPQRRPSEIDVHDPNFCFPQEGDDPQTAMLREFARSKLYMKSDFWGMQQEGTRDEEASEPSEPRDTPKFVKWMHRRFSSSHPAAEEAREQEEGEQTR